MILQRLLRTKEAYELHLPARSAVKVARSVLRGGPGEQSPDPTRQPDDQDKLKITMNLLVSSQEE